MSLWKIWWNPHWLSLYENHYLFQKNKSWPIVKDREKWNLHWNFNNSELSHMKHTQEVFKSDLQALKILLGHFLRMFHVWQLRNKLLKFQWRIHFPLSFTMGHDLFFWNKYWFLNRSQINPPYWIASQTISIDRQRVHVTVSLYSAFCCPYCCLLTEMICADICVIKWTLVVIFQMRK